MANDDTDDTIEDLRARIAELEASLKKVERHAQRLEEVMDGAPALMWEASGNLGQPGYHMAYVSRQIETLLGYTREEWMTKPLMWLELIHPDDKAKIMQRAPQINHGGGQLPEHRFIAKDGREVWFESSVRVIRDASGATVGRRVFALDVTERHKAQLGLDAVLHRLNNIVAGVPGAVWEAAATTMEGLSNYTFISPFVTTLSGYLPEEIVGHPEVWGKIVYPEDHKHLGRAAAALFQEGFGVLRYRWITKDGRLIWVETHIRVNYDEAGAPVNACGVTMDITDRKLAEETEARLKDEVINAQAAILAELGTPLIPISAEVLVMPLVGSIDSQRSERVVEALLHGIVKSRARVAIIDVTGVASVDARTADALIRAARAVRLLGAEVVLTGMRAEVAQTLVTLHVDLEGIVTRGTLESGIAYANRKK